MACCWWMCGHTVIISLPGTRPVSERPSSASAQVRACSGRAADYAEARNAKPASVTAVTEGRLFMPSRSDGSRNGPVSLAWEHARSGGADVRTQGQPADLSHMHPWPSNPLGWRELADCELCGLTMLKLIINSSAWVVRRVEHVAFLDECTVRRRVSIDYEAPQDTAVFCRLDGQEMRILPFAIMRRKSLVNFDFRDHYGHAVPLLGLRQNQALTLAMIRAWAAATLQGS